MAKHRTRIPQPAGLIVQQTVFDPGAHATGGALGAQAQAVAVAVFKGIHLLLDDIRHLADGAFEQLGALQQGHADLFIAVAFQDLAGHLLQIGEIPALLREDVVHTANGLKSSTHLSSSAEKMNAILY